MSQELAIASINRGENVALIGKAGSGKSYTTRNVTTPNTIICAPTGIAALNVGGVTCHSLFGLPLGAVSGRDFTTIPKKLRQIKKNIGEIDRIIIDEAGMLRADYLSIIDSKLKILTGDATSPFGGIQVVLSGDFYQLEPIINKGEEDSFYKQYESPYCFSSPSYNFNTIELTKVYRQSDVRQVKMLNEIRVGGEHAALALKKIVEESKPYVNNRDTLHLCCYRHNAEAINDFYFEQEKGKSKTYQAKIVGSGGKGAWESIVPVPYKNTLKVGSRVLICANAQNGDYVNGGKGVITKLLPRSVIVEVNGKAITVEEFTWKKNGYSPSGEEVESSYTAIPLTLGYAVTVHRVQGITLDNVALNVGRGCFSAGQLYVALSRVRDLRNLSVVGRIGARNIIVSGHVKEFFNKLNNRGE